MAIDYKNLPVYAQKEKILDSLSKNQVVIVQSPTGSGKTTQIPVILHEAGYSEHGVIAVTQPRRIAAMSVSEFISRQLGTEYPGLVGYKMRFDDKTNASTKIKIMTDGILLQEMKLDPWLSNYSVMMVDEAHERSLNIDFVLGLLKRVLKARPEFKVVVSSATMNAQKFSDYFGGAPVVTIETQTFPVTMIYDPPEFKATTVTQTGQEILLSKIEETVERVVSNNEKGDILIFLPGEKIIKDCVSRLSKSSEREKLYLIPLYGRLPKEEQERVFETAPDGKTKVVVSTNIAETSVTIDGISTVIDSGLAKLNFYSPRTFTSSLIETSVSRASCNQRRGRAGRTGPGTCYRLYPREDFEEREEFTTEEIYRTDLSEVVLRMAELGITEFDQFDFISPPGNFGIKGAVETLNLLGALENDHTLSSVGKMMTEFPLEPRVSRMLVESIMHYPSVLDEVLIAAGFMSTHSPFILPPGEEMDARKAHHAFRDLQGDFVSYVKLFRTYENQKNPAKFCEDHYLDEKVMAEIANIKKQLEEEVGNLGIPITGGGSFDDYLCCIASGMIQFVCIREKREHYRSLTEDHISIHPGSSMFKTDPLYIVAGEIVKTSRTFASSVSPLTKSLLNRISPDLEQKLQSVRSEKKAKEEERKAKQNEEKKKKNESSVSFGGETFDAEKVGKGKQKLLAFDSVQLQRALLNETDKSKIDKIANTHALLKIGNDVAMVNEKAQMIFKVAKTIDLRPLAKKAVSGKPSFNISNEDEKNALLDSLSVVFRLVKSTKPKKESKISDGRGKYWLKVGRGFATALAESLSSLESLADEATLDDKQKETANTLYRKLHSLYE